MSIIEMLKKDNILTENEHLRLRKLMPKDHDSFLRVLKEVSPVPDIYDIDGFDELLWQKALSSGTVLTLAVEKKAVVPAYIGECMVKHPEPEVLELGIDIAPEYQNNGIASEAMRLLIEKIRGIRPEQKLIAKSYSDNLKSCHIIRKLGGVKIREESAEYDEAAEVAAALSEKRLQIPARPEPPADTGREMQASAPPAGEVTVEAFEGRAEELSVAFSQIPARPEPPADTGWEMQASAPPAGARKQGDAPRPGILGAAHIDVFRI